MKMRNIFCHNTLNKKTVTRDGQGILSSIVRGAVLLFAALTLFSCSTVEDEGKKAYISVSLEDSRTVLPEALDKESLSYELWGKTGNEKLKKLSTWVSYAKMQARTEIEVGVGEWDFTLKAFKDNTQVLEDTIKKTISYGSNPLYFNLKECAGTGTIDVTFWFPKNNAGRVDLERIKCTPSQVNAGEFVETPGDDSVTEMDFFDEEDEKIIDGITYTAVKYKKENIPSGYYILKFSIYETTSVSNYYTTLVRVSSGCTSAKEETLKKANYIRYSVTYDDGVEEGAIAVPTDSTAYKAGETVTVKFTGLGDRLGYRFIGWSDGTKLYNQGETTSFVIGARDVKLTAQWVQLYSVTYEDGVDGETITVPSDSNDYIAGETVTVDFADVGTRTGYKFLGWSDGTNTYESDGTTSFEMPEGGITLTATWAVAYSVTYEDGVSNATIEVPSDTYLYEPGEIVTVKFDGLGIRVGYPFDGWNDGTTTYTSDGTATFVMGNTNVTLTAQWHELTSCTVTYVDGVDSETITVPSSKTVLFGDTVVIDFSNVGVRAGYYFSGWSDGTKVYTATETTSFTMPDNDVTLTARWTPRTTASGKKGKYTSPYFVGDVVFTDGSATPYAEVSSSQNQYAVAVIFYTGNAGDLLGEKTLGVGIKNSQGDTTQTMRWAIQSANINTKSYQISEITTSKSGYITNSSFQFTGGDYDGSDNWSIICNIINDENTAGNYPAWDWINNYASTYSVTGTYASGWYMPALPELYMLYKQKTTVNSALEKIGGTKLASDYYWSSTMPDSVNYHCMWTLSFAGDLLYGGINDTAVKSCSVLAIREF